MSGKSVERLGWVYSRRKDTGLDTVICQPCDVTFWQCTCMVSVHEQQDYLPADCSVLQHYTPTPCVPDQAVTSHLYHHCHNSAQNDLLSSYSLTGSTTYLNASATQSEAGI